MTRWGARIRGGGRAAIKRFNHYEVLGVAPDAPHGEIKTAFRELVKKYHPDVLPGATGVRFKQIMEAWKVLGNARTRKAYDREISQDESKAPYARRIYDPERPQG